MAASTNGLETRRILETRLIEKAWKDPEFRKQVVSDPKGMLEKQLGQKLPEGLTIHIHEEDANTLHFSVPPAPSNLSELSDEDLAKVAGGTELLFGAIGAAVGIEIATIAAGGAAVSAVATAGAVLGGTGAW
jgi:hypothetical protein